MQKHKQPAVVQKYSDAVDYFKGFRGFAPERTFESFLRISTADAAASILKMYKGKTVYIRYFPIGDYGVGEKSIKNYVIPEKDSTIESLFRYVITDNIRIEFRENIPGYVIQRIVNRDQAVTEIDRI